MAETLMAGVVKVRPDLDGFVRDLKQKTGKALKESSRDVNQQVRQDATKTGKAVGDAVADGVNQGTKTAASKIDSLADRAKKMQDVGTKMTVGITAPVVAGFTAAEMAFADVQDAQAMVDVIFGESSKKVRDFGKSAYDNLGIAEQTALRLSGTLGSLATSFESQDEAADTTIKLIERAADMASVFGGTNEMAAEAITSALRGEMDPIEKYGVTLNEAAVQAKALEMGLGGVEVNQTKVNRARLDWEKATRDAAEAEQKFGASSLEARDARQKVTEAEEKLEAAVAGSGGEIDANAKKMAILQLVMDQTQRTQGDLKNNWDTSANAMKRNAEGAKELAADFGENLDPAFQKFMETASKVLKFFNDLPEGVQTTLLIIAGVGAMLGPALVAIAGLVRAWQAVRTNALLAAAAQEEAALAGTGAGGKMGKFGKGLGKAGAIGAAAIGGWEIGTWINEHAGSGDNKLSDDLSDWIVDTFMADGGQVTRPGWSWVGEEGPELQYMPQGATVLPLDRLPGMGRGGSSNGLGGADLTAVVADLATQVAALAALPRTVNAEIHRDMTSRDVTRVFNGASRDAKNRALRSKRNS